MPRYVCRIVWLVCVAWLLATRSSYADKMTDAEELFRRAKALMAEDKHGEACPLLEESQRLDPQMGTLLNLAICHESTGRLASAWGEFRAVEQQARAAHRDDRVKLARERAASLEPRLSRVEIVVSDEARVAGLVVRVDGEEKGEPLWSGFAVDPGTRTVEISAPGKKTASLSVTVDEEGAVVPVVLPTLEDEPAAGLTPDDGVHKGPRDDAYAANRSRRTAGLVVGGIGVATMAAGGVFGVLAVVQHSDAVAACPQPCVAGSEAARAADGGTDRALVFANVANVVLPIGLVAAVVGGYFFLGAGPTKPGVRASVAPRPGGAALAVTF